MIEIPQSFIVVEECDKATWQNGFRRKLGENAGWSAYESTTANGAVYLAADGRGGPWYLAIEHPGVIAEIGMPPAALEGPGRARYSFENLPGLYATLGRVYALALSLPDSPLQAFITQTKNLPRTTEVERLVVQRVGQDIFRDRLLRYWDSVCPLTGIAELALLRASHIKPWSRCDSDAERLDVHNGLLLSALWDAAFDAGLVSFDDDGVPIFSPTLTNAARLTLTWSAPLSLTPQHRQQLAWHRSNLFSKSVQSNLLSGSGEA
jgi:hypothetical protein